MYIYIYIYIYLLIYNFDYDGWFMRSYIYIYGISAPAAFCVWLRLFTTKHCGLARDDNVGSSGSCTAIVAFHAWSSHKLRPFRRFSFGRRAA